MALFSKKPAASEPVFDEADDGVQRFFDHYFKDLQRRGEEAFEGAAKQQIDDFQTDLDKVLANSNVQLQRQLGDLLNQKVSTNYKQLEASQTQALKLLYRSTKALIDNYQQLAGQLEKHISEQDSYLQATAATQRGQLSQGQVAYDAAIQALQEGAARMQEQEAQLSELIAQRSAAAQDKMLQAFLDNMSVVVEAYVKDALAGQFDASRQMPAIISDLEAHKQQLVDDINL